MRALPPSSVRDTAMLAMLIPASPKSVPPTDHARAVVVLEEHHERGELDLDLESERADEPVPALAAEIVPATEASSSSTRRHTSTRLV